MRHAMKVGIWKPLFLLFGGSPSRAYVDVDADEVTFRFGFFEARVPRAEIASAARSRWPAIGGLGWRIGLRGEVGLIGSLDGVVEVRLSKPRRMRVMTVPVNARRVFVSLEHPEAFLEDLERTG
jgi:hypothetical protein